MKIRMICLSLCASSALATAAFAATVDTDIDRETRAKTLQETGIMVGRQGQINSNLVTDSNTVGNLQDSGLNFGDNARVNASIVTGDNRASTDVNTQASTSTGTSQTGGAGSNNSSSTGINTGVANSVDTVQNSGVNFGRNARVNGAILTGSNQADTSVSTDIRSEASTAQLRDDSGQERKKHHRRRGARSEASN